MIKEYKFCTISCDGQKLITQYPKICCDLQLLSDYLTSIKIRHQLTLSSYYPLNLFIDNIEGYKNYAVPYYDENGEANNKPFVFATLLFNEFEDEYSGYLNTPAMIIESRMTDVLGYVKKITDLASFV